MAISEIATDIFCILGKVWNFIKLAFNLPCKNAENFLKKKMISALENFGVSSSTSEIEDNINNKSEKYYMPYMYGTIQSCPEYKRIHNYKSAQVMYKNLALVLIAGGFVMWSNHIANDCIYMGSFLLGGLFMVRGYKFSKKTEKYTVIWFVDKFK